MAARNFFGHVNPDGRSPFDRLDAAGVVYVAAAENIARGSSDPQHVLSLWFASPPHRAIIEDCRYTHHGVGLVQGRWTQVFVRLKERKQ